MKRTRISNLLNDAYDLGADRNDPVMCRRDTRQRLTVLIRQHEGQLDWATAEAITNSEAIDDMIRVLIDDSTHDNAVCLVRGVIEAYLKG